MKYQIQNRTQEILSRFKTSWNDTLDSYQLLIDNGGFDHLIPIRDWIYSLMENGEWKYYRIGTSLYTLIFSRSVDFGLRLDQKYVRIEPLYTVEYKVTFRDGHQLYREYIISDLQDIRLSKLLSTLKDTLID